MTTKVKIIAGFVIMIAFTSVLAFLSHSRLSASSDNFVEYRRLARFNVLGGDMAGSVNDAVSNIYEFIIHGSSTDIEEALKNLQQLSDQVKEANTFVKKPENLAALKVVEEDNTRLRQAATSIETNLLAVNKDYRELVVPGSHRMGGLLKNAVDYFLRAGNNEGVRLAAATVQDLGTARSAASRFFGSHTQVDADRAQETVDLVGAGIGKLTAHLQGPEGRTLLADLEKEYAAMRTAMSEMIRRSQVYRGNMEEIKAISTRIQGAVNKLHEGVRADTQEQANLTLTSNKTAQTMTLAISLAGVAAGSLLALFIIFGLVRTLNELARFAGAIAAGDFEDPAKVREKGEIGRMVAAMRDIPATLNTVLADYKQLELNIEKGRLDAQGDAAKYKGGFSTLVQGTNAILRRFLLVLENIPSPVVLLDKDLKAAYLNTAARDLAGPDYPGKTCLQLFAREDFDTKDCALAKAVRTRRPASGETRARPQGKNMDISYTVIPMFDGKGELVSVLQLITDLTAVKETQRKILTAAEQASGISNRVAAAAEELSAQVGQVSRGAEMQRDRVESTASAMAEMNSTVLEVARSAGRASEQSELTRAKARDGSGLVNQVVASINEVHEVASAMAANMQELGKQAESIGGVMGVISDIADQTNLLALNAAIEAARAGDAGRGFAVVADSVRQLAEKTMAATQEVGGKITAIQRSTRVNIEAMDNASAAVDKATGLAGSSGAALTEIVDLASANSTVVASIAAASEEQSATSEEIGRSIDEINQVVNDTAKGMVQASGAVRELSRMAQELNHVMESLK